MFSGGLESKLMRWDFGKSRRWGRAFSQERGGGDFHNVNSGLLLAQYTTELPGFLGEENTI
jgi:hypothetical protein